MCKSLNLISGTAKTNKPKPKPKPKPKQNMTFSKFLKSQGSHQQLINVKQQQTVIKLSKPFEEEFTQEGCQMGVG
jgi:hypothetical protein